MKIVILDGGTTNPGDVSWEPIAALGDLTVYDSTPPELVIPRAQDAEALIINRIALTKETLAQLPKLRFIGMLATGYNTVDTAAARELGVPVCNVPLYCVEMVAQQAFTLLLSLCGNVHRYSETVRAGKWQEAVAMNYQGYPLFELYGKTLGIVGYGSIGKCVAQLGLTLGMKVLLYSRTKKDAPEGCRWVDLETLFAESDVVSLHCPLNEQTAGLVNERLLSLMKPTSFLINTSRGGVVDSRALASALNSGKLAGAGVDVMAQEPPAADDPLLTAKNCVISPHIAWASKEARERLIRIVADNLQAFQNGKTQNAVN
ncbi:MAG: D-2-hydroxyacid dehydrogenase [Acutalibacter sp.]|nr:D-2-hydroxyacid dehydrogenase [Acutalibacter sp.]